MPIDTQSKRRAAGAHLVATTYPVPSGTINPAARETVAWLYPEGREPRPREIRMARGIVDMGRYQ